MIEQKVIAAVKACTNKKVEITVETNLESDLGFDSLDSLILMSELDGQFQMNIDESQLVGIQTVSDIVERIKQFKGEG